MLLFQQIDYGKSYKYRKGYKYKKKYHGKSGKEDSWKKGGSGTFIFILSTTKAMAHNVLKNF